MRSRGLHFERVGIRQIRPANRTADDEVAADEQVFLGKVIGHMARRVAGGVDDDHFEGADLKPLAVGQEEVGAARGDGEGESEEARLQVRMFDLEGILPVDQDPRFGKVLPHHGMIGEMVEMAVGQP